MLDSLVPRDRTVVAALIQRLGTFVAGDDQGLKGILPELGKLIHANAASTYSLRAEDEGFAMERFHVVGELPREFLSRYLDSLRTGPRSVLLYDPARPDPSQRNRVRRIKIEGMGAAGREIFRGSGMKEQLRVLLCEGPGLLAWVGGLSEEAFGAREARILEALTPALLIAPAACRDPRSLICCFRVFGPGGGDAVGVLG